MTKPKEMVMKTVHDLGAAGASDVQNYTGLSATKATKTLNSLARNGYLKIAARRYQCDVNARDEDDVGITFVGNLYELTPKGKEAAQGIPDIDEPMCIPITKLILNGGGVTMKPIDIDKIDKLLADVHAAFMHVQSKVDDVVNRDVSSIVQAEIQRLIAKCAIEGE